MRHEDISSELMDLLYQVKRSIAALHRPGPLGNGEMAVMRALRAAEERSGSPLRMSDISAQICASRPAATQVVNRLEGQGLVSRYSEQRDRRTVYVRLTDEGHRYFDQRHRLFLEDLDELVDRMGRERAALLVGLVREANTIALDLGREREDVQ